MEKNKLQIRVATKEDAEALLAIYAPYVEQRTHQSHSNMRFPL